MLKRVQVQLVPRSRPRGDGNPTVYLLRDRQALGRMMGAASKVTIHARVYDRSGAGVVADFAVSQGCFSDDMPADGPRLFTLTLQGASPALAWNNTNMPNLPDDGTFYFQPTMGNVDFQLKVSGGANTWIEIEIWATLEYAG